MREGRHQGRRVLACAAGAVLVTVSVVLVAPDVEVVERGRLLTEHGIETELARVRVLGLSLYVDVTPVTRSDAANALVLASIAVVALLSLALIGRSGHEAPEARSFMRVVAVAAAFLTLDELLSLHETVGDNALFLGDLPGVTRPDDALLPLYLVVAALLLVRFRHVVLTSRLALACFAVAGGLFVSAAALDVVTSVRLEEALEVLATFAFLAGLLVLAREQVNAAEPDAVGLYSAGLGTGPSPE